MMNFTHILFIDDDEISTFLSTQLLKQIDSTLNIESISSGEKAIEYAKQGNPIDLIFLDINMPGMDGIEFISEFDSNKNNTKVIVLTSMELPKTKLMQLQQVNCCEIILKPLTREKFEGLLNAQEK